MISLSTRTNVQKTYFAMEIRPLMEKVHKIKMLWSLNVLPDSVRFVHMLNMHEPRIPREDDLMEGAGESIRLIIALPPFWSAVFACQDLHGYNQFIVFLRQSYPD